MGVINLKLFFTVIISLFFALNAFAHGEDKPGPSGGFIRMPGAFHTELVPDSKGQSFQVYLLDINFKNPTVKDSSVEMQLEQKDNKIINFNCSTMGDNHFFCKPKKKYLSTEGKLILKVKREKATGQAEYKLPL